MEQLTIKMQLTRTKHEALTRRFLCTVCFSLTCKIPQAGLHLASSEKNWRYFGGAIVEPVSF